MKRFLVFLIFSINQLLSAQTDTNVVKASIDAARALFSSDPNLALAEAQKALYLAEKINDWRFIAKSYNTIGSAFYFKNQLDSATYYQLQALSIQEKLNDTEGKGRSYANLSSIKSDKRQFEEAIAYAIKAEKEFLACHYFLGLGKLYNIIGGLFYKRKDLVNTEKYFLKAKNYIEKINDDSFTYTVYSNLGNYYDEIQKKELALSYYIQAYTSALKNEHVSNLIIVTNNLCAQYLGLKNYELAKKYGLEALALIQKNNVDSYYKVNAFANFSEVLKYEKNYVESKRYIDSALHLATLEKNIEKVVICKILLSNLFNAQSDYKAAYNTLLDANNLSDSLYKTNLESQVNAINETYETEKKDLKIQQQQDVLKQKTLENKRKTIMLWLGIIAFSISSFFAALAFINFRKARKANHIIQNQNEVLTLQKTDIAHQKELIEEKQREIIDSINYAQRIQQAVLTSTDVWEKISKDYFIFFRPKDIVSGDFYWAYNTPNGRSIFAIADCTGHGVPGGFMSMLGNSFLNELVIENKLFKADIILNKLRTRIIQALEQQGKTNQKDGMDMALCVWNRLDNTLEYAGANNPLWLVRQGKITEFKANKMPIGTYTNDATPFTAHTITLQKEDCLYLSTDGFPDQFGGDKGKKYKYKNMELLFEEIAVQPMKEQGQRIEHEFKNWKGTLEQLDDVCILGIKI